MKIDRARIIFLILLTAWLIVPVASCQPGQPAPAITGPSSSATPPFSDMSIEAIAARAGIYLQPSHPIPKLDRLEWRLLTANSAIKSLDIYSTQRMLARGWKEGVLPDVIAAHPSIFSLYDSGVIAAEWLVARKVTPRHPRLAHWLTIADMVGGAACVVNNFTLPTQPNPAPINQPGPVIITNPRMKHLAGQSVSPRVRVGLTFSLSRRNPLAGSRAGMPGWNP